MKFGTIGAGEVALAIARQASRRGHEVTLGSRRPAATRKEIGVLPRGVRVGTVAEAAALDYVLLAVPWPSVGQALTGLPAWNGRVLIDATNPPIQDLPDEVLADLGDTTSSEHVASLVPGARVVKAFNSIPISRFNEGPVKNDGSRVIFVSGDDENPKAVVSSLIESFGFMSIDLGSLAEGGKFQQAGGPLAGRDLVIAQ